MDGYRKRHGVCERTDTNLVGTGALDCPYYKLSGYREQHLGCYRAILLNEKPSPVGEGGSRKADG